MSEWEIKNQKVKMTLSRDEVITLLDSLKAQEILYHHQGDTEKKEETFNLYQKLMNVYIYL